MREEEEAGRAGDLEWCKKEGQQGNHDKLEFLQVSNKNINTTKKRVFIFADRFSFLPQVPKKDAMHLLHIYSIYIYSPVYCCVYLIHKLSCICIQLISEVNIPFITKSCLLLLNFHYLIVLAQIWPNLAQFYSTCSSPS